MRARLRWMAAGAALTLAAETVAVGIAAATDTELAELLPIASSLVSLEKRLVDQDVALLFALEELEKKIDAGIALDRAILEALVGKERAQRFGHRHRDAPTTPAETDGD